MLNLSQQIRYVLRSMSRGVPRGHQHFAKCELIAVSYLLGVEPVLCPAFAAGINLRRFQLCAQLARTTHQIGMNMGFKNVRDDHAGFACRLDVDIAVRTPIKYRCDSFIIVADEITKLSDTFSLHGVKTERHN